MPLLTTEALKGFLTAAEPPCISLYQPTHRAVPDSLQDPIRYRNLVRDAERELREKLPERQVRSLLERFEELSEDKAFWMHQRDGLTILASGGVFEVFRLQRPVKELVVVADSFHIKPLLRIVQSADRFQVLALDRQKATLYEGDRYGLDEVDVGDMPTTITEVLGDLEAEPQRRIAYNAEPAVFHGQGGRDDEAVDRDRDRFFRAIDSEVLDRFSRASGLPLVLAALPEYHAEFRRVSRNPSLQPEGVAKDPGALTVDELRGEVWKVLEPHYLARLAGLIEDHRTAAARGMAATDLGEVAKATAAARVRVLMVEADRLIPGRFDPASGEIRPDRLDDSEVDDLTDDLAEAVLRKDGEVIVVPPGRMPSDTGVAATFRF
jgi:hypothetical protein